MKIENAKGQSPYARHHKAPYKYSDHYNRWLAAVERYGRYSEEALKADYNFRTVFGVPTKGVGFKIDGGFGA